MKNPFRRHEEGFNVVQEVGRDPLRPPADCEDPLTYARSTSVARRALDTVLRRRFVTDVEEQVQPTPQLVFKPDALSTVVVIHASATDPRVETYVRGEDNEFSLESVDRGRESRL